MTCNPPGILSKNGAGEGGKPTRMGSKYRHQRRLLKSKETSKEGKQDEWKASRRARMGGFGPGTFGLRGGSARKRAGVPARK